MRARVIAPESMRLDKLLAAHTKLSRKRATAVIERGGVRVDGKVQTRASLRVPPGALVEVHGGAGSKQSGTPTALPERFRDRWLLVVDKPSGLPSQPTRQGATHHVYGILSARERYVGLHHRLDRPASGLLLLTLDKSVNAAIAEGFRTGSIHRRYLAVVVGDPGEQGVWDDVLDDKRAVTHWERLATADGLAAVMCTLQTGRTHQIRRHAAGAGHPIAGDRRHGGAAGRIWPRLALHAQELWFDHPISGERQQVESIVPDDLADLVERAGVRFDDVVE